MSSLIKEVRLVALGPEAHGTVCGLAQPTDEVGRGEVFASREVWAEIRSAFPTAEACPGKVARAAPMPGAGTARILVSDDGETFYGLNGCRAFEVPAEWEVEEIEEARVEAAGGLTGSLGVGPTASTRRRRGPWVPFTRRRTR